MAKLMLVLLAVFVVVALLLTIRSRKKREQPDQTKATATSAAQDKIDSEISDLVARKVREGFDTRDEIVDGVTEAIEDEYKATGVNGRVAKETDRLLEEHLNRQASWPKVTDCDKIDAAFADLAGKGIVARQNFTCCQTCGNAEIGAEIKEFEKTAKPLGYTYYHMQDMEGACAGGTLYLAFGTVRGTDADAMKIGETIRDALAQHGLKVEWNGSLDRRICITGLDWKKRRIKR